MRILHVIPNLMKGGAERLTLDICIQLQKLSHDVVLVTFSDENAYQFLSKQIVHKVIPSSVSFSIKGKDRYNIGALQQFIEEFQPEIIHSHLFESEAVLSGIKYDRARYYAHFHDNIPQLKKLSWQTFFSKSQLTNYYERQKIIKQYLHRNTSFIAISRDTFSFAKNNLPKALSVKLLFNAIHIERFENDIPWDQREERAVMIGSFVPKKGQQLAIEVIYELKKSGHNLHLDLLGNGPLKDELIALSKTLEVEYLVHFHGNVDHPEDFLKKSKIYLHTAKYEPFGLVILEAMAAGCPIVSTDGIGNRDLIENKINGIFLNERNPKQIASSVIEVINNKALREKIIKGGNKTTLKFSIESYTDELVKFYN